VLIGILFLLTYGLMNPAEQANFRGVLTTVT